MVIWRLKLVSSLHLGSAEPSMTKMVNWGVARGGGGGAWASLGNSAPVIRTEVAEVRTIQQIKRLCTCSQLASQGILGSAEPRNLQMVIWRLKLVNSLHLGSAEPSMTKMVN